MLKGGSNLACNLGSASGHSVLEVIETVERVSGKSISRINAPRREGDPAFLVADNQKAREVLGWKPEYGLEEVVASAYAWHTGMVYRTLWQEGQGTRQDKARA